MKSVIVIMGMLAAQQAFAGAINGTFKVVPADGCDLQGNTTERIDVVENQVSMNLYIGDEYPGEGPWTVMFEAKMGDIITRPTPDIIKLGYTTVDRQIGSYLQGVFRFEEYLYDMTLTDAQGLAAGPYKTIVLEPEANGDVSYTKQYNDGETYRCQLVRN